MTSRPHICMACTTGLLGATPTKRAALGVCVTASLMVLGCATPDVDRQPSTTAMRELVSVGIPTSGAPAEGILPIHAQWWQAYGDKTLNALVDQATSHQPSLQVAHARVQRAQALMQMAESIDRPQVSIGFDATHQRYTQKGLVPPSVAGTVQDTGTLQISGVWEFDFFGKNQSALRAALGQARAAQAEAAAAQVLLQTQVVRSYVRLTTLQSHMQWAQRTLQQRLELASLVRQRVQAGLDSDLELQQADSGPPEARTHIESLREQIALTQNALAALTGHPPGTQAPGLAAEPSTTLMRSLPVPRWVPSDWVARRPDLQAARWRVEAALGERDQARAQFYPTVNLVAFAGLSSIGLDRLLQSGAVQWGLGPAVRLPWFDGGRLRAHLQSKQSELEVAVQSYNATLVEALKDVLDPLATLRSLDAQQAQQQESLGLAQKSYQLVKQRQASGLANTLQTLLAETPVIQQHRLSIELQSRRLDTEVALIRALGGGYQQEIAP